MDKARYEAAWRRPFRTFIARRVLMTPIGRHVAWLVERSWEMRADPNFIALTNAVASAVRP